MPSLKCPFVGCAVRVKNRDKDMAIASFDAHIHTHTAGHKSREVIRPRITQEMSADLWKGFRVLWDQYKIEAEVSEEEYGPQLIRCCSEELRKQICRTDPGILARPEIGQLESI